MRLNRWHRITAALAIMMLTVGGSMVTAGVAEGAQSAGARPILIFNSAAQQAQLTIPTPPCPKSDKHCKWMLYMNLPTMPMQPRVGYVLGKSGTLTIDYPKFCGQIQADALVGPAPWIYKTGIRTQIHTCHETTTTTTTTTSTTSTTTTTTTTTRPTTTSSTVPPVVAASSTTPTTAATSSALPFSDPSTTSTPAVEKTAAELPFTGVDIKPLGLIGTMLIILGGILLSTVESRRRMFRRAAAVNLDQVKDGVRNTTAWFLGQ